MNSKYTTHQEIYSRLSLTHKHKQFTPLEIAQWCAECSVEVIGDIDRMERYVGIRLPVVDKKAMVPCNLYRILEVFDNNLRRIEYRHDGVYLDFHGSFTGTDIYITYMGVPVDTETGYPLIKKGHEKACEAYCVYKMYYEDFLAGRLDATRWGFVVEDMNNQVSAAGSPVRHMDRKDFERINKIHGQLFMRPGWISLYDFQFNKAGNF